MKLLQIPFQYAPLALLLSGLVSLPNPAFAASQPHFTVAKDPNGIYWFADRQGKSIFSSGINNIASLPFRPREGTQFYSPLVKPFANDFPAWSASVHSILTSAHFNTVGAWSDPAVAAAKNIYRTPVLYAAGTESDRCLDTFRPGFAARVRTNVEAMLSRYPDRSDILGVFLDNEMPWFGINAWDAPPNFTLLERAFTLPTDDPARLAALDHLRSKYSTIAALNNAWGISASSWESLSADILRTSINAISLADRESFVARAAETFYSIAAAEVRRVDPTLLILGSRFAGDAPESVIRACGKVSDVISVNYYSGSTVPLRTLAKFYVPTQKPLMITEFSWRAKENQSGNPNSRGAGAVLLTQAERAASYSQFVEDLAQYPMVIGICWFEWADQSPQGRFDGEDSNYGVVDIHHNRYEALLSAMTTTNAKLHTLHQQSKRPLPTQIPPPSGITLKSGQQPGRPPSINLLADWLHDPDIWGAADSSLSFTFESSICSLTYSPGYSYGAGLSFYLPTSNRATNVPDPKTTIAADADGYTQVVLDAELSEGTELNFVLAEANCVRAGSSTLDDGEAFLSDPIIAKPGRHAYRVNLADFKINLFHGNQTGQKAIDMASLGIVGIQLKGGPAKAQAKLHNFTLEK
jgi:agarase